jgi:hypothetical protein
MLRDEVELTESFIFVRPKVFSRRAEAHMLWTVFDGRPKG